MNNFLQRKGQALHLYPFSSQAHGYLLERLSKLCLIFTDCFVITSSVSIITAITTIHDTEKSPFPQITILITIHKEFLAYIHFRIWKVIITIGLWDFDYLFFKPQVNSIIMVFRVSQCTVVIIVTFIPYVVVVMHLIIAVIFRKLIGNLGKKVSKPMKKISINKLI